MNKHIRLLMLPLLMMSLFSLTSCSEEASEYVGEWVCTTSYEKTVQIYWGNEKVTDSQDVPGIDWTAVLVVKSDRSVQYVHKNGETTNGRISVMSGKASFSGLNFSSSYKFKLKKDDFGHKKLEYSWSEDKHCLDCSEKRRHIVFEEKRESTSY